jgi:hypothetical protein
MRPPCVTISSPRRRAATIAWCSFTFFCCGRISRKYMIAKIRISGMNWPKASIFFLCVDGRPAA